ncbi:MAG TPA: beta-ketoacyl synthase N-terminal-like domain-containing protein, partial [Longimicrobium sp.]|nr:beta-ketoacyl synthase N-terminal-like domain-containing protein [Longimicrobium sp.]
MNAHRGVVNRLVWMQAHFSIGADDVVLQKTPFGFDVSVWEFFWPLQQGARLVMARPNGHRDPAYLQEVIEREGVTTLHFVPSMLQPFVETVEAGRCASLRHVVCSGEALPPALVARFHDRFAGPVALTNLYGPTEAAVDVSCWTCPRDETVDVVPIGRPVWNTALYVLDAAGRPAPVGVPGELYIGGVQVARGYQGRAAMTAERFVPDPFSTEGGARLYRTGDRARWRADGAIEYLGRLDFQVKVRGFRIELGEIEAVLRQAAGVRDCTVVVRDDETGDRRLVAYVVGEAEADALREHARRSLPEYMVPSAFVALERLPLNANGKLDRKALPAPEYAAGADRYVAPRTEAERKVAAVWAEVLGVESVGAHDRFFDLGGHSLLLVRVQARLREAFGQPVPITHLFRYLTVSALAAALDAPAPEPAAVQADDTRVRDGRRASTGMGIAVVGMAGRFPGAPGVDALWANLRAGVESIRRFTDEELAAAGVPESLRADPAFVPAQGALAEVDLFDAAFFGFTPREAEVTDPQQRLFLEVAWEALEHAGYDAARVPGRVGVYAGASMSSYYLNLLSRPDVTAAAGGMAVNMGNAADFLAPRAAFKMGLEGPAVVVQTACSTSLVAVNLACQALLGGVCDMALVGGSSVTAKERIGYLYQQGNINSPDGHCRAFDAQAGGTVGGSGVAVAALKRLEDALADGDTVHAVILASAINNDGSAKISFTAPRVEGQAAVIRAAHAAAEVDPATITYVEAHGTGTELGDPIEIEALTQAFRAGTDRTGYCAIGSIKTNLGHLDAAAGIAGLIKTTLALRTGEIPPSLHFTRPNPQIDFASSPFFVNATLAKWTPPAGMPRRAGVSSFGIGGTNAHVVMEEPP